MIRIVAVASLFALSALFHALALQWPSISVAELPETHLLFVVVNLWFAQKTVSVFNPFIDYGNLVAREKASRTRFYAALVLLTLHEVIIHGYLLVTAALAHHFDFQSAGVIVGLGVVWALLLIHPKD